MFLALLLFMGSTLGMYAQTEKTARGTFNPNSPPEPEVPEVILYYRLTVKGEKENMAYTSGSGKYKDGTRVYVYCSARSSSYVFSHWTLNGDYYSDKRSFYYTTTAEDVEFVAHFDFVPSSPQEPNQTFTYKLNLETNCPTGAAFNISSGNKYEMDSYVNIKVTYGQGYEFLGWYKNDVLLSKNSSLNYQMPAEDVTITARLVYNPINPSEPESDGSQEDVANYPVGDVNLDGVVDIFDVVALINRSLDTESTEIGVYDVNKDGAVDVFDVVEVINISLN